MKKKKKGLEPRSAFREKPGRRRTGRGDLFGEEREGGWPLGKLPAQLLHTTNEHIFEKSVAAILVVIFLGLFSLVDLPLTNRLIEAIHRITVYQVRPAELVEQIQPVIQSVRNLSWRREEAPSEQELPANGEKMGAPVSGVLVRSFGPGRSETGEGSEMQYGIVVAAEAGSPVYAALSGVVSLIRELPPYGLTIYIEHAGDIVTIYGRSDKPMVAVGEHVSKGQQIAVVAGGPQDSHLHFEVWQAGVPVDPQQFIGEGS